MNSQYSEHLRHYILAVEERFLIAIFVIKSVINARLCLRYTFKTPLLLAGVFSLFPQPEPSCLLCGIATPVPVHLQLLVQVSLN